MEIYYYILFFIFGICLGSFYNVLAMRLPKGESIIKPKSHCPKCLHELKWYELIPIISFIIQKGKCKNCQAKLSFFYPFTELVTGLLFVISYYSFGFSYDLIIALILVSVFVLVIVSDLSYLLIPDSFILIPNILILIITILESGFEVGIRQVAFGLFAFLLMYFVMLLGNKLFKKESLGGADIKLMFLVGLTLDPMLSVLVIFLASIIALPVSLFLLVKNKEHVIPYGPFLMLGLLIVFFMKMDIQEIFNAMLTWF